MIETGNLTDSDKTKQFGIAALFWITFLVGLAVAYLQRRDSPEILLGGVLSILIALAVGLLVGRLTNNFRDALFWAVLIGAFGYISVASDPLYGPNHCLAWGAAGAVSGAIGGTCFPGPLAFNVVACAIAAGLTMLAYWLVASRRTLDLQLDLITAPIIGGIIAVFIRLLMWVESRRYMPRYVTATWLMIVVILGNYFSR